MGKLKGKTAVVLGASSADGMGAMVARRFAEEGANVVVAARRAEPLRTLAEAIGGAWTCCDIARKADVDALVAFARSRYGRVDIGVNAAAADGPFKEFVELAEDELEHMLRINYTGALLFMQAMIRSMEDGGALVMFSSVSATAPMENFAAYAGAKAGLNFVVRCVANEVGGRGIRVNGIAPGLTATDMAKNYIDIPGFRAAFLRETPLARIGTVRDMAAAATFLASDDCFMTGEILQINGGFALRRHPSAAEIQAAIAAAG